MPWLRWIFQPMQSSSRLSIWVLGASLRMRNTDRIGEGVVWMCDLGEGPGVVHSWLSPEVRHDSILARLQVSFAVPSKRSEVPNCKSEVSRLCGLKARDADTRAVLPSLKTETSTKTTPMLWVTNVRRPTRPTAQPFHISRFSQGHILISNGSKHTYERNRERCHTYRQINLSLPECESAFLHEGNSLWYLTDLSHRGLFERASILKARADAHRRPGDYLCERTSAPEVTGVQDSIR